MKSVRKVWLKLVPKEKFLLKTLNWKELLAEIYVLTSRPIQSWFLKRYQVLFQTLNFRELFKFKFIYFQLNRYPKSLKVLSSIHNFENNKGFSTNFIYLIHFFCSFEMIRSIWIFRRPWENWMYKDVSDKNVHPILRPSFSLQPKELKRLSTSLLHKFRTNLGFWVVNAAFRIQLLTTCLYKLLVLLIMQINVPHFNHKQ